MGKYIASAHISNTGGIGIREINQDDETVSYDIVTDRVLGSYTVQLEDQENEDTGEVEMGFYHSEIFWPLSDFMVCN